MEWDSCGQFGSDGISSYLNFMCHTGFLTVKVTVNPFQPLQKASMPQAAQC